MQSHQKKGNIMTKEYINIGAVPCNEDCAQVGDANYYYKAGKECNVYIRQLWRLVEQEFRLNQETVPESFNLVIKDDYEVVATFDPHDEKASMIAYYLEANSPLNWDEAAKKELAKKER